MRTPLRKIRRGITLIELSIAIMMGMAIGSMTLLLFNQQLTFLRFYRAQNFLTEEAPIISMYVNRLVGKADRFRMHNSVADALSGTLNPLVDGSGNPIRYPVILLNFREPDGTMRATILAFHTPTGKPRGLYYYIVPATGTMDQNPQWAVTTLPQGVGFTMREGILRMTLTGPNNEEITYSGTMQQ